MWNQIKLARLRRNLSVGFVAERADIGRAIRHIENGSLSVAISMYAAVSHINMMVYNIALPIDIILKICYNCLINN